MYTKKKMEIMYIIFKKKLKGFMRKKIVNFGISEQKLLLFASEKWVKKIVTFF